MIRIVGHGRRIALRHLIEIATGAVLMGGILLVVNHVRRLDPLFGIGLAVGIPVVADVIGGLIGAFLRDDWLYPPELSWDQQGLRYGKAPESYLRWSDYQGYRFTWEYPARVKIRRRNGRPFKIDLFAFSQTERTLLLAELDGRRGALPNTRLKLTAPS